MTTSFVTVDPDGVSIPDPVDGMTGILLAWRWADADQKRWRGLVRFAGSRSLQYEQWIGGEYLRRV